MLRIPDFQNRRRVLRQSLTDEQRLDREIQSVVSGVQQMAERISSLELAVSKLSSQMNELSQKKLKSERVTSDIRKVLLGIIESPY